MRVSPQQISEDLISLLKHTKSSLEELAERHGLTHIQLYVLRAIHQGDTTMSQVAGNLHCNASNVTGIIDRLVVLHLVDRHESEKDRRAKKLSLTDEGRTLLARIVKELPDTLGCGKLNPSERAALHELIDRLV